MQNVPGGQSSSSRGAGYVSHNMPATQQVQPEAPTSRAYLSLVDPTGSTAAFQFTDPINETFTGYATDATPTHVINEYPNQLADPFEMYQPGVEIPEYFQFLNPHPLAPLPAAAAGPPVLNHGIYGGRGQQQPPMRSNYKGCDTGPKLHHSAANGKAVGIREPSTGRKI
ncbi:hypothetical protein AbraIFM66951_003167 [Aspergillus brasiliensis]|uniref:Uncharacterized protein n=1 Tax=Aspergillus brasiliensis TaxID=319629 RepID=A0A9W6DR01_9EURO|nr:hypothetical protein AbraCBS73388_002489 [Aspergillus brasiliensis]GKZ50175.1 hypothetical protein AbraIFM66951_003167 [Aspergillus brasiliensis]